MLALATYANLGLFPPMSRGCRRAQGAAISEQQAMQIAGVSFADEDALAEKVRAQLSGGGVWADRADYQAVDGMRRALRGAGRHQKLLARLVADHFVDSDVVIRTGAVAVAGDVARILGADAVAEIAKPNQTLLAGVAPQGHRVDHADLWWQLLIGIASSLTAKDSTTIELFRANAGGPSGSFLLASLAKHDSDWLVAHAADVVPARSILGILRNLPGKSRRAALVQAVSWTPETATQALAKKWSTLPLADDEIAQLRQIIRDTALVDSHQ